VAIALTPAEESWIADHPRIRVHFEPWPPFLLEQDGQPAGITVDYLNLITNELGLEIEWVRTEWTRALSGVRDRDTVDVLPILTHTTERDSFLLFTRDYVSFPIVIFSRLDADFIGGLSDLRHRHIVVERNYAMHARLKRDLPDQNLTVVDNTPDALRMVATGGADAYLGHLAVGSYLIQRHGLANLKVAAPAPFGTHDQAIGVRQDWPHLAALLDRGLESVTTEGHANIRRRWLSVAYQQGVPQADVWVWALRGVIGAIVILMIVGLWVRRLRREVDERRRTEERLERSRHQLLDAEHLTGMGSWTYDRDTNAVTWSPQMFRLMGHSPDRGAPLLAGHAAFFRTDDWPELLRAITGVLDDGRAYELELHMRRGDGEDRTVICRGARPPGSDRHELIGTVQDVTAERRATALRERLQGQLREAQKLESIGSLAGDIAHDFNDLLVTIRGSAELALDALPTGAAARDDISEVMTAALSASELCRQMLAYSGEASLILDQLELSSVVRGMSRMLDVSLSKKATVEFDLAPDLPSIDADPAQMQQVVLNLALNASEALGDDPGVIAITTNLSRCTPETFAEAYPPDLPAGEYLTLVVRDTGPGMNTRTREQLFDPFFSGKATGRGMGMAAVLGIVRAHRGAIRVDSEPGRGTTVIVWLPRGSEHEVEETAPPPERLETQRPTVLIVDDNDGVRRTARRVLSRRGFEVLEAPNGRVALEVIAEHSDTDCVILDITMPEMDGMETYRELMKIHPDMPVIMTSGYHTYEKIERTGDLPVAFVQKPFDVRTLVDAVNKALQLTD